MVEVRMLGPVEAVVDGRSVPVAGTSQRTVLACLALARGRVVPVDTLAECLWGDDPPSTAVGSLQAHVSRLRRVVGGQLIPGGAGGYRLVDATTDVTEFERLASEPTLIACERALALWRGPAFAGLPDREPFTSETRRLDELRRSVEERRADLLIAHDPARAAVEARALADREPLRQHRWEVLARALSSEGRQAEALRALDDARTALAEVGLEPSPTLTALADEVIAGRPAAAPVRPSNVPHRAATFVGRERERSELSTVLTTHRIVTLVGPGGVGKTSLAQVTALEHEPPVHWCDLSALDPGEAVVPGLAAAVGIPLVGDLEQALLQHLRDRVALVVLDNCEHVITECARLVGRIVTSCPHISVLATSREPLAVPAERVIQVRPMTEHAVDLFIERATAAGMPASAADRAQAESVCSMLDGLPLAIEMAAARARSLGLSELATRLAQGIDVLRLPERAGASRHGTIEAVVEWSTGLLSPQHRLALRRATVFAGGFDLPAAQAVVGAPPSSPAETADLLAELADRSLIVVEHGANGVRYSMLETVRQVVATQPLAEAIEPEIDHARHYSELAEAVGANILGPHEREWAARADVELANMRGALFGSLRRADGPTAVRICAGLHRLAYHRLRADVAAWAGRALPELERMRVPGIAVVIASAALEAAQRDDLAAAGAWCEKGRRLAASNEELIELMIVECDIAGYEGRFDDAIRLAEETARLAMAASRPADAAVVSCNLALSRSYVGDHVGAELALDHMRGLVEAADSATLRAWMHYAEGEVLLDRHPERAAEALARAVSEARRTGAAFVEGVAGVSAASLAARHGDPISARTRFVDTIQRWRATGDWVHQWVTLRNLAVLLDRLDDYEGAWLLLEAVTGRGHVAHGEEAGMLVALRRSLAERLGPARMEELARTARDMRDEEVVDLALRRLEGSESRATFMMTDIVGSTRLVGAIGNEAWALLLAWHDRMLDEVVHRNGGRVIDRAGDGILASFSTTADAVECARAIQRSLRAHRTEAGFAPQLRIGLHRGSAHLGEGSASGLDVHITSRVTDAADPDQILMTVPPAAAGAVALDVRGVAAPLSVTTVEWR